MQFVALFIVLGLSISSSDHPALWEHSNESLKELLNDRCLLDKIGKLSSRGSPQGYLRGQQRAVRENSGT